MKSERDPFSRLKNSIPWEIRHLHPLSIVVVGITILLYIVLFALNSRFLSLSILHRGISSHWMIFAWFAISSFVALLFLIVGNLVWLYGRNRLVAWTIWLFFLSTMITFSVQIGAKQNDYLLSYIGSLSSPCSILFLVLLLLIFPHNLLDIQHRSVSTLFLCSYIFLLIVSWIIEQWYSILYYEYWVVRLPLTNQFGLLGIPFFYLAFAGIILIPILSYRLGYTQTRAQLRYLMLGVSLVVAPVIILSIVPTLIGLPSRYIIDPQLTSVSFVFLPVTIGYSFLRHQLLVLDSHVRRIYSLCFSGTSLVLLSYLALLFTFLLFAQISVASIFCVLLLLTIFTPIVWTISRQITQRFLTGQTIEWAEFANSLETGDLLVLAEAFARSIFSLLQAQHVALFVLDDDTGLYRLTAFQPGASRIPFDHPLLTHLEPLTKQMKKMDEGVEIEWGQQIQQDMESTQFPIVLVRQETGDEKISWQRFNRYILPPRTRTLLLLPIQFQGQVIAMVVANERQDNDPYAGPDLEASQRLCQQFASSLEQARLFAQSHRHLSLLQQFFQAGTKIHQPVVQAASQLAQEVSNVTRASVEIWLTRQSGDALLERIYQHGPVPDVFPPTLELSPQDEVAFFYPSGQDEDSGHMMPHFPYSRPPMSSLAWLPLFVGSQRGVMVLHYPAQHHFSLEEQAVLISAAARCSAILEDRLVYQTEQRSLLELQETVDRQDRLARDLLHSIHVTLDEFQSLEGTGEGTGQKEKRQLTLLSKLFRLLTQGPLSLSIQPLQLDSTVLEGVSQLHVKLTLSGQIAATVQADRTILREIVQAILLSFPTDASIHCVIEERADLVVIRLSEQQGTVGNFSCWLLCQHFLKAMDGDLEVKENEIIVMLKRGGETKLLSQL